MNPESASPHMFTYRAKHELKRVLIYIYLENIFFKTENRIQVR